MDLISALITVGIVILVLWIISKILREISPRVHRRRLIPRKEPIFLSWRIKANTDREFNRRLGIFKRRHKRKPTRNELFRIIISISHNHIKGHGKHGHWGRQKIRKYLLEKHGIVDKYVMR